MKKKLFIFLVLFSGLIQAGENNFRVRTSDGKELTITQDQLNRFGTLQNMVEDLGELDAVIPLPEIITDQAFQDLLVLDGLDTEEEIQAQLQQLELPRILDIIKAGMFLEPKSELLQFGADGNNSITDYIAEKLYNRVNNSLSTQESLQILHFIENNPAMKMHCINWLKKDKGEFFPIKQELQNVNRINWDPSGTSYFVHFEGGRGQLFTKILTNDELWERFLSRTDIKRSQQKDYARKGIVGKALLTLKNWWNNEL